MRGLTLTELLLAVALIGVIGGMSMIGQVALLKSTIGTETASMAQTEALFATEHIYRNLYKANRVSLVPNTATTATEIDAWVDSGTPGDATDDVQVKYKLEKIVENEEIVDRQIWFYPNYIDEQSPHNIVARQVEEIEFIYKPLTSDFNHLVEVTLKTLGPQAKPKDPQAEAKEAVEITTAVLPRGRNNQ